MSAKGLFFSLIISTLLIGLTSAQVVFEPMKIAIQAGSGETIEVVINISNEGEEVFEWVIPQHPLGGEVFEPWELIRSYDFGQIVEDANIYGVAFIMGNFYVSRADQAFLLIYSPQV